MAEDNVGYIKISTDGKTEIRGLTLEMAMELVHHEYIYLEERYRNEIRRQIAGEGEQMKNIPERKGE